MFALALSHDDSNIAIAKAINHLNKLYPNQIQVTEEQYNSIKIPCELTIENEKVIVWKTTTLPLIPELTQEPTIEERLTITEDTINFLLGL